MEFKEEFYTAEGEMPLLQLLLEHYKPYRARELIRNNLVLVNDRVVNRKSFVVVPGDRIMANVPQGKALDPVPENIPIEILYEDDELLVINKPKGMPVSGCPGHYTGTLQNALLFHMNENYRTQSFHFPHRIDMNTSGCILAAKTKNARRSLSAQINDHTCCREYTALTEGIVEEDSGTIDLPIGRSIENRLKYSTVNCYDEKACITKFRVLERFEDSTLLHITLETGRTHQIRTHMEAIGHPIIGDTLYGSTVDPEGIPGQTLHAESISFTHPVTGERMMLTAPLPEYFRHMIEIRRSSADKVGT
ncbi:MAG: RluA family pseudouridine synthase [Erysipelotrichaceae bacterium]|nr:RluA family pseudouridine synthase [Erysipelotrichaceae bacterium]